MGELVTRWFVRHWRNDSSYTPTPDLLCRLCARERAARAPERNASPLIGLTGAAAPVCTDCIRDARRLLSDPDFPTRDIVRSEVLRALRAEGEDEAERLILRIADGFPDLARANAKCSGCTLESDLAKGVNAGFCRACIDRFAERIEL